MAVDDDEEIRTSYVEPDKLAFVKLCNPITKLDETTPVEVLTQYPPQEVIPCITMHKDGGKGLVQVYEFNRLDTDGKATEKVRREKHERLIGLHFWSHNAEERDFMVAQLIGDGNGIDGAIPLAKMRHYKYCQYYVPGTTVCTQTGNECDVLNPLVIHPVEFKCPFSHVKDGTDPDFRNPKSIFEHAGIPLESISPRGEAKNDQLDLIPELFHSIVLVDYEIFIETILETKPFLEYGTADEDEILK